MKKCCVSDSPLSTPLSTSSSSDVSLSFSLSSSSLSRVHLVPSSSVLYHVTFVENPQQTGFYIIPDGKEWKQGLIQKTNLYTNRQANQLLSYIQTYRMPTTTDTMELPPMRLVIMTVKLMNPLSTLATPLQSHIMSFLSIHSHAALCNTSRDNCRISRLPSSSPLVLPIDDDYLSSVRFLYLRPRILQYSHEKTVIRLLEQSPEVVAQSILHIDATISNSNHEFDACVLGDECTTTTKTLGYDRDWFSITKPTLSMCNNVRSVRGNILSDAWNTIKQSRITHINMDKFVATSYLFFLPATLVSFCCREFQMDPSEYYPSHHGITHLSIRETITESTFMQLPKLFPSLRRLELKQVAMSGVEPYPAFANGGGFSKLTHFTCAGSMLLVDLLIHSKPLSPLVVVDFKQQRKPVFKWLSGNSMNAFQELCVIPSFYELRLPKQTMTRIGITNHSPIIVKTK